MICPGCNTEMQWIGSLCIWWPKDGGQALPYSLCEPCSQRMARGDYEEIARKVDLHFTSVGGSG